MTDSIGSKRVVVGAHYGLRDWLAQRITATLMALFTFLVLFQLIFSSGPIRPPPGPPGPAGFLDAAWSLASASFNS
jgi:succinate dehydrogenase / fumarate reductase membrane anchor subunit